MSALRRERRREILLFCQAKDPKEYFVYFKGLRRGQGSKGTVSAEVEVPNGFYYRMSMAAHARPEVCARSTKIYRMSMAAQKPS